MCKVPKNHSFIKYSKARKCNANTNKELFYKYVIKIYCATCLVKKEKCLDCKNLPPKYTFNNKFILFC